ncbi:MAG: hypothetical protein NT069_19420 [Planctomycetota bacterium]|nr:hypothetical protein [Planctomycetota bacterium]
MCVLLRTTHSGLAQPHKRAARRKMNRMPHGPSGGANRCSILDAAENATSHLSRMGSWESRLSAGIGDGPIRLERMGRKIDG